MSSTSRVYVVEVPGQPAPRLVRATFAHIAERYAIGTLLRTRVASKEDLIDLLSLGYRVEDAADDPLPPRELGIAESMEKR